MGVKQTIETGMMQVQTSRNWEQERTNAVTRTSQFLTRTILAVSFFLIHVTGVYATETESPPDASVIVDTILTETQEGKDLKTEQVVSEMTAAERTLVLETLNKAKSLTEEESRLLRTINQMADAEAEEQSREEVDALKNRVSIILTSLFFVLMVILFIIFFTNL